MAIRACQRRSFEEVFQVLGRFRWLQFLVGLPVGSGIRVAPFRFRRAAVSTQRLVESYSEGFFHRPPE